MKDGGDHNDFLRLFFHYTDNLEITVSPFSVHVRFRTGFWKDSLPFVTPGYDCGTGSVEPP